MNFNSSNKSGSSNNNNSQPKPPYPGWMWQDLSKKIIPPNMIFDKQYGFHPVDEGKGQGWVYEAKDAVPLEKQSFSQNPIEKMKEIERKNDLVVDRVVKEKYPTDQLKQEEMKQQIYNGRPSGIPNNGLQWFNEEVDPSDARLDLSYFENPLTLVDSTTGLKFQPKTKEGNLIDAYPYSDLKSDIELNKRRKNLNSSSIASLYFLSQYQTSPYNYDYKRFEVKNGQYEPYGNLTYGALGTALGFSADYLYSSAGLVQANRKPDWGTPGVPNPWIKIGGSGNYGDDPRDTYHMNQVLIGLMVKL
jgi:hypothetical protein